MGASFSIGISDVVKLLGLEIDPKTRPGSLSYNVKCPFCDTPEDKRYHMNINEAKDAYRCVRCSGDEKRLGVLELYSRVRFGCTASQKGPGNVYKALAEEMHLDTPAAKKNAAVRKTQAYTIIKPAADDTLDAAYSALLALPYIRLSAQHRLNLFRRGLGSVAIARNRYGSIVLNEQFESHTFYNSAVNIYKEQKEHIKNNPKLSRQRKLAIIAGLIIAHDLGEQNIDMKHVPGFFLLDKHWCMKVDEGMLIPTRNQKGQIVGIQTRTDAVYKEGLRYITLSSKDLDAGPNTDISRIHFPLGNADPEKAELVGLTEGPLKADIAVALFGRPVHIMAVQGVNNTRELNDIISSLEKNISSVANLLDMDRFVNIHVQKAANAIKAKFAERNIEFYSLVWDMEYFKIFVRNVQKTCENSGIAIQKYECGREDDWIFRTFNAFSEKQMSLENIYPATTGCEFKWKADSKGIDDYLKKEKLRRI